MVSKNDITHDRIMTKGYSEKFRQNAGKLWGKSRLELQLEKELAEKAREKSDYSTVKTSKQVAKEVLDNLDEYSDDLVRLAHDYLILVNRLNV